MPKRSARSCTPGARIAPLAVVNCSVQNVDGEVLKLFAEIVTDECALVIDPVNCSSAGVHVWDNPCPMGSPAWLSKKSAVVCASAAEAKSTTSAEEARSLRRPPLIEGIVTMRLRLFDSRNQTPGPGIIRDHQTRAALTVQSC